MGRIESKIVRPAEAINTITGSGTAGELAYWQDSSTIVAIPGYTWNGSNLVFGALAGVVKAAAGVITASTIVNADVSAVAAIAYSKLNLSGSIVNADVNASAAIAYSKLNLAGGIVNADVNASAAIAYSKLNLAGGIVNADVNASAAIAYSKLNLTGAILNADLAGSIAYSKLVLTGAIVNADVSGSAAIAYSKLNLTGAILNADLAGSIAYSKLVLTGAIVNADVSGSAAIAYSKLNLTGAILNADLAGSIAASKLVGSDIATVGTVTTGTWSATTIAVDKGGTGLTSYTAGDLIYATAGTTLAKRAIGTEFQALCANATPLPEWREIFGAASIINLTLAVSVAANAITIALKDNGGSDCSATSPAVISFRSATAATGTYTKRKVTGALSVTASSGSNLGQSNAQPEFIYVYAIDNAGTVELAISSSLFDEGSRQTTTAEGGAGAADDRFTLYSTTARSNVAVRLIGRILTTQTTAGTWAAGATEISLAFTAPRLFYDEVFVNTPNGLGSTNTYIRRWTTVVTNRGTAITYADSATLGGSFTVNVEGFYCVVYLFDSASGGDAAQTVSVNSATLNNIPATTEVLCGTNTRASAGYNASGTFRLKAGDIVRCHSISGTLPNATTNYCSFRILRVG